MIFKKNSFSKNSLNLLGFSSTLIFCADLINSNLIYFTFINYFILIFLSLKLVDLKKLNLTAIALSLVSLIFMFISCLKNIFDIEIFLKYVLILFSFFICVTPKRELNYSFFRYSIYYPLIFLLFIGILQIIIISFIPQLTYYDLGYHTRPIGLSVEPTFYSQQILILYVLSDNFKLRKEESDKFSSIINLLVLVVILFCRTRTSLVGGLIYILINQKKISKNFLLISSSSIIIGTNFISTARDAFSYLFQKIFNNFLSIKGEPREVVFQEMLFRINTLPIFGYGFNASPHKVGLMIGSLYANLPISAIYTLGIGSIPFLAFLLFIFIEGFKKCDPKLLIIICIFIVPMPFLYSSFGLFSLIMSSYTKKYINLKITS